MLFLLLLPLPLLSLILLLTTTASFPQPQDRGQNQQVDNTDTDTDVAAAAYLGDSLGTSSSQDPSAWWNQVDNNKPGWGARDSTGPSISLFDASSPETPPAAAAETFLLPSTSGTLALLPPPAHDPKSLLDNQPTTSSPSSDTIFSTDSSNDHPSPPLSPHNGEVNPETQTDGSSASPSPGTLTEGQQQQVALIGDETGVGFPLNILPALGGDAPAIDLPALLEIFNPKIPQPQYPIRYNDKERLEDPKTPDCDDGTTPFCCNIGPPDPAGSAKNAHKRRDCRSWGIQWEGCHWRQNMFCCKCADRSTNARIGIGCYNVWYRGNPFYYEKKVPNPVKPAIPRVGLQQQSGGEEGDAVQQLPGTGRRKSNLPGTGKAKPDSCSKDQLDHWRDIGYI